MKHWFSEDKYIKIYNEDCLIVLDKLIDKGVQVDLTVTSPPYDDIRDYNNTLVWDFNVFKEVAQKLYNITKNGGILVWVVGDSVKNGSKTLTSFEQAIYFKSIGFNVYDVIIYHKTSTAPPHKNRYFNTFEYMFILSKGKPKTINLIKDRKNKYAGTMSGLRTIREKDGRLTERDRVLVSDYGYRTNIWSYAVGHNKSTTDKIAYKHPAIFPEKLAQDHILSWSNEGDLVLDCFMGSGTTGKMCKLLNRRFIGIEKVENYFNISIQRIGGINNENNH